MPSGGPEAAAMGVAEPGAPNAGKLPAGLPMGGPGMPASAAGGPSAVPWVRLKGLRTPLFWGRALGVVSNIPCLVKGLLGGADPEGVLPVWNAPLAKEAPLPKTEPQARQRQGTSDVPAACLTLQHMQGGDLQEELRAGQQASCRVHNQHLVTQDLSSAVVPEPRRKAEDAKSDTSRAHAGLRENTSPGR
ncbi:MAG: hypothetical protein FRX49_01694 [Trebouxia sp. A1-2]|nr:MAG: hypothetical protein FRX49_01694 [Trebouxia sp. A1-2]